jgi:uncharacterized protein (TIGR02466 family)
MPTEYFFPTPIYFTILENIIEIDLEFEHYLKTLDKNSLTNPWDDTVKTNFFYGPANNSLDNFPVLTSKIIENVNVFLNNLGVNGSPKIIESWINLSDKFGYQNYHIHDGYALSGVYYYQTNGNDGDLVFSNPSLVNKFHPITSRIDHKIIYKPEKGKLIIFPSFLEHAVLYNSTESIRISLSFNIRLI